MERLPLIDADYAIVDPYGSLRSRIDGLKKIRESKFEEPSKYWRISPEETFERYKHLIIKMDAKRHKPYLEYNEEMFSKWGAQGGALAWNTLEKLLLDYYDVPHTVQISKVLYLGRDILMRLIKSRIDKDGYPKVLHDPVVDTFAGSPTALQKGDYLAESLGAKLWRHVYPITPNTRRMRNSDRVIFEDSILNVRLVEDYLLSTREWLKTELPQLFNGWLNPKLYTNKMFTASVMNPKKAHIEWDYIKMDKHFIFKLVAELLFPIYEMLLPDGFLRFATCVEELFSAPLFMGNEMWTGEHALFSGQGFTNDFETLYSIILALGVLATLGHDLSVVEIAAIGDDMTLPYEMKYEQAKAVLDLAIEISNQANMLIHDDEKSRIAYGETRFCRHVYYPAAKRDQNGIMMGAYPSVLALNSMRQPEKPDFTAADACLSTLQRSDNVEGSPEFVPFIQFVQKYSTLDLTWLPADTKRQRKDWFERVYGVRWDPIFSPTYNRLAAFNEAAKRNMLNSKN